MIKGFDYHRNKVIIYSEVVRANGVVGTKINNIRPVLDRIVIRKIYYNKHVG